MSPRAYRLGKRHASIGKNRASVIAGARKLLKLKSGAEGFSVETVARHAGVARTTVYHQFKSKTGLLEAVYDDLAARAELPDRVGRAFQKRALMPALKAFINAFCHFWAGDRAVIRRLHALADIDPDFTRSDRSGWRRRGIRTLLARHAADARLRWHDRATLVDIIHTLTTFETYDRLARGSRGEQAVAAILYAIVKAWIDQ